MKDEYKDRGSPLTRWSIFRHAPGRWLVCGPSASGRLLSDCPYPTRFTTGAEAISTFAAGGKQ